MAHTTEEHHHHTVPYSTFFWVLGVLLVLTALTVGVTVIDFGIFSVMVALLVATVKAAIVLLYFMHLKFDDKLFIIMVAVVFAVYTAVIVITFFDYLFR